MSLGDPLAFASCAELGAVLAVSTGWAAYVWRLFPNLSTPDVAPAGIFSLQFALTRGRASAIVGRWKQERRIGAACRSLWLDLAFIALYAAACACAVVLTGRATGASGLIPVTHGETVSAVGAALVAVAATCDLLENVGLALTLRGQGGRVAAPITAVAAGIKCFILACLAIGVLDLLIASAASTPR
ncbi:hypothetical protein [Baekduia sp. Peel2402]|uniref:hypothetical protein n=1 Tax=Baekduia sp. Peel2402 TaxID=3458296 RepID=UPI00403E7EEE